MIIKKKVKKDKYGRPLTDVCMDCGKEYKLDYRLEDKYKDDQLGPVRGYCPKCNGYKDNHYYPFI